MPATIGEGASPIQRSGRSFGLAAALVIGAAPLSSATLAQELKFPAGDWLTECATANPLSGCSLTGVFRGVDKRGTAGSFAVVVGFETLLVAIVGQPPPDRATIRIDRYPPQQCAGPRYCVFKDIDAVRLIQEFGRGSTILIDVTTGNTTFRLSLSTKGYQAGLAKIRAAGQ
jgi:hypothetical protein